MADVSMGDVGDLSSNEGLPLDGAVDDSALHDYAEFQGLSDELGGASGFDDEAEEEPEGALGEEAGIDSASFEGSEPEEPEEEKSSSRAQKRIQNLSSRNKELEQGLQQQQEYFQRQMQALQYQMQQNAARPQEDNALAQQLALQQQQLQMLQQQKQSEEYSNLSPLEQLKIDILKESESKASSAIDSQLSELRKQLENEKSTRLQSQQEAQRKARYEYYNQQTSAATKEQILGSFKQEDASQLREDAEEMVLAMAGAFGIEPSEAAVRLKGYMDKYMRASMSARSSTKGQKVRKSRSIPKPASGGRRQVKGGLRMPSLPEIKKAGYDNHIDWIAAGEPSV